MPVPRILFVGALFLGFLAPCQEPPVQQQYTEDKELGDRLFKSIQARLDRGSYQLAAHDFAHLPDVACLAVGRILAEKGYKGEELKRHLFPLSQKVNQRLRQKNGALDAAASGAPDSDIRDELPGIKTDGGKNCTPQNTRAWLAELLRNEAAVNRIMREFEKPGMISAGGTVAPILFIADHFEKLGEDYIVTGWAPVTASSQDPPRQ